MCKKVQLIQQRSNYLNFNQVSHDLNMTISDVSYFMMIHHLVKYKLTKLHIMKFRLDVEIAGLLFVQSAALIN